MNAIFRIITEYDPPPEWSQCEWRWTATLDGWEPGDIYGGGPTEDAAIGNLLEDIWLKEDEVA